MFINRTTATPADTTKLRRRDLARGSKDTAANSDPSRLSEVDDGVTVEIEAVERSENDTSEHKQQSKFKQNTKNRPKCESDQEDEHGSSHLDIKA